MKLRKDGTAVGAVGKHVYFDGSEGTAELAELANGLGMEADGGPPRKSGAAAAEDRKAFLRRVASDLSKRDGDDAAVSRNRVKEIHQKRKRAAKEERRADGSSEGPGLG